MQVPTSSKLLFVTAREARDLKRVQVSIAVLHVLHKNTLESRRSGHGLAQTLRYFFKAIAVYRNTSQDGTRTGTPVRIGINNYDNSTSVYLYPRSRVSLGNVGIKIEKAPSTPFGGCCAL